MDIFLTIWWRKGSKPEMHADLEENDGRLTHYYLWIPPFVLAICLIVIKAPRILWSELFERGMIQGVKYTTIQHITL